VPRATTRAIVITLRRPFVGPLMVAAGAAVVIAKPGHSRLSTQPLRERRGRLLNPDMRFDKRKELVDRGHAFGGYFLIDELRFVFIDGGGRQRCQELSVGRR
jgi:hypothetical protein